jgi:hypothetical protein
MQNIWEWKELSGAERRKDIQDDENIQRGENVEGKNEEEVARKR